MLSFIKSHPRAFTLAVIVHIVFALMMGMSLHFTDLTYTPKPQVSVVEAVAVDEKQVAKELKRIKSAEQSKQRKLQQEIDRARAQRKKEERRLAALKRKQQQEHAAEQKRLAKIKAQKQKLEQERRAEEQRLKKTQSQRAEQEKALEQLDKTRKEEELKRKLAEEQQRIANQSKERQSTIDRYRSMIEAEVRKHWQIPPTARAGMGCELRVRLLPSGEVIRVEVVKGSGNSVFDKSVQKAVRDASPLPVPKVETGLFEVFRDLRFPFKLEKKT
jgi:colicin import membrane protein